jgi:elongation factor Ts
MGDCRKALIENDCDMDAAVDFLRKSGLAKAAKKASRATNEGRVVATTKNGAAVLFEMLCETDFVAKNDKFVAFCSEIADRAADIDATGDITEAVRAAEVDSIAEMTNVVGENLNINRVYRHPIAGSGAAYIHLGGKIGVIVDVDGETDDEYRNNLCMHVAAFAPAYLNEEEVPAEDVERERAIFSELDELKGKPENVLGKIVEGKVRKWLAESCLVKQNWIWDSKTSVEKVNPNATILAFQRWQLGGASEEAAE